MTKTDELSEAYLIDSEEIKKTREILGDTAKDLSDDEIRDIKAETQYLADSWLDDFERTIFDGKTLNEYIGEKYH